MAVYVLADTHFGNKHLLQEKARKQFKTITMHDRTIKDRITATCGRSDTLFLIGDVVEYPKQLRYLTEICRHVGKVNIVLGNHDGLDNGGFNHPSCHQLLACGVNELYGMFRYRSATLTHTPRHPLGWHRTEKINVHGHFHSGVRFGAQYLNVAGNVLDFYPLNLDKWLTDHRM